jgi:hypothetical protein
MRNRIFSIIAGFSLLGCVASSLFYFLGRIGEKDFKGIFLLASSCWFLFASLHALKRRKGRQSVENSGAVHSPNNRNR